MLNKKRVVFIVKYFYPIKRPSGITSFLYDLCQALAKKIDLSVISYKYARPDKKTYHRLDYDIYKVSSPFPIRSALLARRLKPDLVITFSGIYQPFKLTPYFFPNRIWLQGLKNYFCQCTHFSANLNKILDYPFLNSYQKIIGLHPAIADQLKQVAKKEIINILPGLDFVKLDHIEPQKKEKKIRIGFFGHFTHRKGADQLVQAFLKLNDQNSELLLGGGNGPLKKELLEIAQNNPNLKILDYQNDILSWMKSCDFIVLPYRSSKSILGLARTAQEAMYMGIPIIASDLACLKPLVKDNLNGLIFKDENDLLEKMKALVNNPELRKKLAYQAHLEVKNNYAIKKTAEKFLEIMI